ncbi:S66 peptidase family protein [Thermosulfuriphilus sp.]
MNTIGPLRSREPLGIFFPSSAPPQRGFLSGLRLLETLGNPLVLPPPIRPCRYLAGSDKDRLAQIDYLLKEGLRIFWAARGGYGAIRLLGQIPWERLAKRQVLIIGFSDTTALLNAALARIGLLGLHAPVVATLNLTSLEALRALGQVLLSGILPSLSGYPLRGGQAEGTLIGGNLTTFVSLIGTPFLPQTKGALLFLEEIGEAPYRVDRFFNQLRLSGILEEISALLLGNFAFCGEIAWDLILEIVPSGLPIIAGLPVGHGAENFPLLIGGRYRVVVKETEARLEPL